ncbi:MAG: hypothetical protein GKR77_04795 [Legionellales bacterium]|nr:hypothetical protein [Legionellales bacterium]
MIKGFVEFVLRHRLNALAIAVLTFLLPLLSWIASVVVGLVTLRHGWREGGWIVVSLTLVLAIVFVMMDWMPMGVTPSLFTALSILTGPVLVWGLAGVLRNFHSWSQVLTVACYLGCGLVMLLLALGNDPTPLTGNLADYIGNSPEIEAIVIWLTTYFSGLQVTFMLLNVFIALVIARGMQAMVFNPGGLYPELIQIRLPMHLALFAIAIFLMGLLQIAWAKHLVPVVSLIYFLAGLSVLHFTVQRMRKAWPWLVGFYGLLLLLFLYVFMAVAALGVVDTWVNVRRQLSTRRS